jgi:hypothetical protein
MNKHMNAKAWLMPLAALLSFAACDDGFGPQTWDATPDTTVLYSLSRPELIGRPSAYDFTTLVRLSVESTGATGNWDAVLAEEGNTFVFVPSGNFPGIVSRAGIGTTTHTTLESLTRAPGDTAAYSRSPVPLREGAVYVVRSRIAACLGFGSGTYYAKFQVISIDAAAGTVRFAAVRNPYCNNRDLIPEEEN